MKDQCMKIVFSVVSHNQQELVQKFLDSMDRYINNVGNTIDVIITENCLSDIHIKSEKFSITKLLNLRQKGFGSNHNSAFEKIESDYFFIINPDIELFEEFNINKFIEYIEERKLDISSPKIINPTGKIEDFKRANLTFLNLIKRKMFKFDESQFDWLAGMFLVIRSNSFRRLQGFDTNFFMYVEDCDLSMRARRAGMRIGDIENFSVIHDARRASKKNHKHLIWHISSLLKYWLFK